MATNEIISYDLSLSPNLKQIERMLDKAFITFPEVTGLVFHSDQGWQYQHAYYRKRLNEHGIIQSMSFFERMKKEMYYGFEKDFDSCESFSKAVKQYIDYYNNKRIQRKSKWMPCSIQNSIHVFNLINMCPGFWVHLIKIVRSPGIFLR